MADRTLSRRSDVVATPGTAAVESAVRRKLTAYHMLFGFTMIGVIIRVTTALWLVLLYTAVLYCIALQRLLQYQ